MKSSDRPQSAHRQNTVRCRAGSRSGSRARALLLPAPTPPGQPAGATSREKGENRPLTQSLLLSCQDPKPDCAAAAPWPLASRSGTRGAAPAGDATIPRQPRGLALVTGARETWSHVGKGPASHRSSPSQSPDARLTKQLLKESSLCRRRCTSDVIPETSTASLNQEEQHFSDDFHPKFISLTPRSPSDLWFLVGIALEKVKRQTNKAQLREASLNEAKMERKELPG